MLFNSVHFLVFAPIVIGLVFFIPQKWQRWWLLVASFYFYAVANVSFVIPLFLCIFITYVFVRWMVSTSNQAIRRFTLICVIVGNLSILYFLKYMDLSFWAWNHILGLRPCDPFYAHAWGMILPMGISFFTLMAIGYAVDVYKGFEGRRSFLDTALFLSVFFHLVAGPILRGRDLIDQFKAKIVFYRENLEEGLRQICLGIVKKTFLADNITPLVDKVFAHPTEMHWISLLMAVFLHAFQIYCDFSGYSDIAIGSARIMGFRIPENFHRPFLSTSMTEMWRRWHISFSSWVRDYIYFPLGGSRVSPPHAYFNLFITMFVSGVWHGPTMNFVLWGTMNALWLVLEKFFFSFARIRNAYDALPAVLRITYVMAAFSLALFFFRARTVVGFDSEMEVGYYMLKRAFSMADGTLILPSAGLALGIAGLWITEIFLEKNENVFKPLWERKTLCAVGAGTLFIVSFCIYAVTTNAPFLYFQF
ncbi:MAG: MBOAT family protein [Leptospirales bacterium]|nr:MBOAT family protein [Leptospirales bacterium]